MKFALFGKQFSGQHREALSGVLDNLQQHEAEVLIEAGFHKYLSESLGIDVSSYASFEGGNVDADFAVSIGGDGTFLKVATLLGAKQTPIIGINTGRLGFLADVPVAEAGRSLDALFAGSYDLRQHVALEISTDGDTSLGNPYALNDIAVLKRDNASMISIHAEIDKEYLTTYQADGLIVSTPTGSTAYSLSNGGPIIVPQTGVLCLSPVAPHSLNIRPIVVSDDAEVVLKVESRSHNFLVAIDGRSVTLTEGMQITIRKAPFHVNVVRCYHRNYFSILREKLMWGADKRI